MTELLWWHRVGQRVTCVRGGRLGRPGVDSPRQGCVYTVRDVVLEHVTEPSFRLVELVLPPRRCHAVDGTCRDLGVVEPVFSAARFRPVRAVEDGKVVYDENRA